MEESFENCEQEVLLAISRLGDQARGDAILHAVRGSLVNKVVARPIGEALGVLERQGLIARVATGDEGSKGGVRYIMTAEGNRVLADEEENLANLRLLVDRRIARYYRSLRSERKYEHKIAFWSGIGGNPPM